MKKCKVILVDDDADEHELFGYAIDNVEDNIECNYFFDGKKALMHVKESETNVIFLDLNMPVFSGLDFMREYKNVQHFNNSKIVVISTSSEQKDINDAMLNGASSYIVKPHNMSALRQEVINALSRYCPK